MLFDLNFTVNSTNQPLIHSIQLKDTSNQLSSLNECDQKIASSILLNQLTQFKQIDQQFETVFVNKIENRCCAEDKNRIKKELQKWSKNSLMFVGKFKNFKLIN